MEVAVTVEKVTVHYCRMLLTRHYDHRPFDETVCDAIITNGGVKNHQKRCKMFAMAEPSNTVNPFELFAMRQNNRNRQPYQCVCVIWHTSL